MARILSVLGLSQLGRRELLIPFILLLIFSLTISSCRNPFADPDDDEHKLDPPAVTALLDDQGDSVESPVEVVDDVKEYTLELEDGVDPADEEGLVFRAVDEDGLPEWISISDAELGVVTVDSTGLDDGQTDSRAVEFYTSYNEDREDDPEGGSTYDTPFEVTFEVEGPAPEPEVPPAVTGILDDRGDPVESPVEVVDDVKEYTLQLEDGVDPADEEGLVFRAIDEADLPDWISISNAELGVVTVDSTGLGDGQTDSRAVEFYTSYNEDREDDPEGGSTYDTPFEVTFEVEGPEPEPEVPPAVTGILDDQGDPVESPVEVVNDEKEYTLELEDGVDPADAEGLVFRAVDEADLPDWISISNAELGVVTVDSTGLSDGQTDSRAVEFYTSYNENRDDDPEGGSTYDAPFEVTFEVEGPPDVE